MKNVRLKATKKTPEVTLDAKEGFLEIKGLSIPENAASFYQPIVEWLDDYVRSPAEKTVVNFDFILFNTSSSKWFISILKRLSLLEEEGIEVNWIYAEGDEDLMEYGEELKDFELVPMNLIEKT